MGPMGSFCLTPQLEPVTLQWFRLKLLSLRAWHAAYIRVRFFPQTPPTSPWHSRIVLTLSKSDIVGASRRLSFYSTSMSEQHDIRLGADCGGQMHTTKGIIHTWEGAGVNFSQISILTAW